MNITKFVVTFIRKVTFTAKPHRNFFFLSRKGEEDLFLIYYIGVGEWDTLGTPWGHHRLTCRESH
jgi:hypothetical protein